MDKNTLDNGIKTCFEHLDYIEDFLEDYDETTGLAFCNIDYDEAIEMLRSTLRYIIKCSR